MHDDGMAWCIVFFSVYSVSVLLRVCANKTSALCVVYAWGLRGLVTLMLHVCRHQINALFRRRLVYAQCQAVCWRAIMGLYVHLTFIFPQQIEAINFLTNYNSGSIPDTVEVIHKSWLYWPILKCLHYTKLQYLNGHYWKEIADVKTGVSCQR